MMWAMFLSLQMFAGKFVWHHLPSFCSVSRAVYRVLLDFTWTSANRGSVYRDTMRVINHLAAVQSHIQNWGSDSCAYKCLVCVGDGRTSKYSSLTTRCTRHGTSLLQQEAASPFKAKRELVLSWWNVVAEPSTLFLNWTNVGIPRLQDSFHKMTHWGAGSAAPATTAIIKTTTTMITAAITTTTTTRTRTIKTTTTLTMRLSMMWTCQIFYSKLL